MTVSVVADRIIADYPSMVIGPCENVPGHPSCYRFIVLMFDGDDELIAEARSRWEGLVLCRLHDKSAGPQEQVSEHGVNVTFIDSREVNDLDPATIRLTYYESSRIAPSAEGLKTAVVAVHTPTGISVECDQALSTFHNRMMAYSLLRLKVMPVIRERFAQVNNTEKTMAQNHCPPVRIIDQVI